MAKEEKDFSAAKMAAAVFISSGITFGSTQLINEEVEMCKRLIEHEARHKDAECAVKRLNQKVSYEKKQAD